MANLAIKGHARRGNEIIEILEMLNGKIRRDRLAGNELFSWYYINGDGYIDYKHYSLFNFTTVFTLEEFLEKFPYKVGDKVNSKYLKNYKIEKMEWEDTNNRVIYKLQGMGWYSVDELQPYKEGTMEDKPNLLQQLKEYFESTPREVVEKEWHEYDKYNEISPKVNEYLEYVNNIRQPQYPKTFIEVLNFWHPDRQIEDDYQRCYKKDLIEKFQDLLYARDAYWKIAGEEMGLGKPWEPDWTKDTEKYVIYPYQYLYSIDVENYRNTFLAFPTREMRDAFYENFKDLIENCKELL